MQLLEDDQALVGVASRDSLAQMVSFVDRHGLDGVVNIADDSGVVWERFGVFGQPTWAYVDGDSGRVSVQFGGLGQEGVLAAFAADGFS